MSDVPSDRSAGVALNERAMESLEFIRTTMARSAPFTAVSGRGGMAMGLLAIAAAVIARAAASDEQWLGIWIGCAVIAVPVGFALMRVKASDSALSAAMIFGGALITLRMR